MENIIENNAPFLTLQHLEKVYPNGEKAVYDFNLDVNKRDFIVIVGPSGCGKSTTLRMIAGLEDITSGDIYMNGELLNYKPSKDRQMAIVFQSYALYPQMNVFENIAFPLIINTYPVPVKNDKAFIAYEQIKALEVYGREAVNAVKAAKNIKSNSKRVEELSLTLRISSEAAAQMLQVTGDDLTESLAEYKNALSQKLAEIKRESEQNGQKFDDECRLLDDGGKVIVKERKYTPQEIRVKVFEVAEKLDLVPYLDKLPKELSGGQMQRVALGRAIIKNVPVFMMDEPLSNLDAKLRLSMRSEIVKLHNRINATTIYVTHDQTEAMTMATRIVVMSRGFVQQIGTPEEVYTKPDNIFVARFIGSPAMNIFSGDYNPEKGTLSFGGLTYNLGKKFMKLHDEFYDKKIAEFTSLLDNFDEKAKEKILKILSATGEAKTNKKGGKEKKNVFVAIKNLFGKKDKTEPKDEFSFEREVCLQKLQRLKQNRVEPHKLTVGVRSERTKIEKAGKAETETMYETYPTVCELLGGEYSVHFDFCGKDMVGSYDAIDKITPNDKIAVRFEKADMHLFDTITGDAVK